MLHFLLCGAALGMHMLFGFFRVIQFLFSCVPIKCSLQKCLCRVHDWLGFSVTKFLYQPMVSKCVACW
jgi:hypothetical protein